MARIGDTRPLLFGIDLVVQFIRHAVEFGNHRVDLLDLPLLFVDLESLQANNTVTRLHLLELPIGHIGGSLVFGYFGFGLVPPFGSARRRTADWPRNPPIVSRRAHTDAESAVR
jgi:hypothetical protein